MEMRKFLVEMGEIRRNQNRLMKIHKKNFKNEWKNHRKSYEIGKNNQKCGMQVFSEIHEAR